MHVSLKYTSRDTLERSYSPPGNKKSGYIEMLEGIDFCLCLAKSEGEGNTKSKI